MLEFIKRFFSDAKRNVTESDTASVDNLSGTAEEQNAETDPNKSHVTFKTSMSLHPDWEIVNEKISYAQKELMEKEVDELPPFKEGYVAINGIYAVKDNDRLEVGIYLTNGLNSPLKLGATELAITNLEDQILARQKFDLGELGEIPAHSTRPWDLYFNIENLYVDQIKYNDWKIVFDYQEKLTEEIKVIIKDKAELIKEEKEKRINDISEFIKNLPKLNPGEISFTPYQAKFLEDGNLSISVVVRNMGKRQVKVERLPMIIKDAKGELIANGTFNIQNFVIGPHTVRLNTMTFPKEALNLEGMDLRECNVEIKK